MSLPQYSFLHAVSSGGSITYSEVITFLKVKPTVSGLYKSITDSWNNTVSLTRNHLIFARQSSSDKFYPV